jgi:predicted  nucleic acid-binding Zn-ribbon protein
LGWGHKRALFDQINNVFDALKQYRKSQNETHLKDRISKLNKILKGIEENMQKDKESLQAQKDKLSHYIRGNKSSGDWGGLLKITEDRIKEKEEKAADIRKTLADLKKKLEKEQQRQDKEAQPSAPAAISSEEDNA